MRFCVLGSGSKGNSIFIESGSTTIVIDAGFSGAELKRRLAQIARTPESLTALLLTHEHADHVSGAGVLSRRYSIPVYANAATHLAAEKQLGMLSARREFATGESFTINELTIHPFAISHDTADPVGFLVSAGDTVVGCCTDTGRSTKLLVHYLRQCHGLVLEANHDPAMLMNGPYPLPLKQRIRSKHGHLSNAEAGQLLVQLASPHLRQVVLAHLSETNNHPDVALHTVRATLGAAMDQLTISVARQEVAGPLIDLNEPPTAL